jgi:hypothetical protein
MRPSDIALSIALVLTSCNRNQPGPGPAVATVGGSLCTTPVCAGRVFMAKPQSKGAWQPVSLSPEEDRSMRDALSKTKVADPVDQTHVHADVNNGRLVFSSDNAQDIGKQHVTGDEPQVSLGRDGPATSSIPVKVVATPEAARLLQQKLRP